MITLASHEDIDEISKFIDDYYREDYFLSKTIVVRMVTGEVDPKFGNKRQPIFVWLNRDKNGICGVAFVTRSGSLIQLLIRPDCRGMGLGKELLEYAKPKMIRCKTDVVTGDPRQFYFKCGYKKYQSTLDGDIAKTGKKDNIILLEK